MKCTFVDAFQIRDKKSKRPVTHYIVTTHAVDSSLTHTITSPTGSTVGEAECYRIVMERYVQGEPIPLRYHFKSDDTVYLAIHLGTQSVIEN